MFSLNQAMKWDRKVSVYLRSEKKKENCIYNFCGRKDWKDSLILLYSEGSTMTTHPIAKLQVFQGRPSMVEHLRLPRKETPTYENIKSLTFGTDQYHGTILMAQTILKHSAFKTFNKEIEKLLKKSVWLTIIYYLNENLILWHSYNLSFQIFTVNFLFFQSLKVKKKIIIA